jgi:two-component system response regulator
MSGATADTAQPLILVAEDHPDHAYFLTEALSEAGLTRLHHVADGDECLQYLGLARDATPRPAGDLPALLLLDIRMPAMDGYQVVEHIRSSPAHDSLPVLVLSTSSEQEDMQRMRDLGATAYVRKPIGYPEYLAFAQRLHAWWQGAEPLPDEQH